jgi:pSer/pThr/pTyr-binding forkhead associated (FHA) protein
MVLFTAHPPSSPPIEATSPPLSPTSPTGSNPSRIGRLRGLSYLRNYTHHLHLRSDSTESATAENQHLQQQVQFSAPRTAPLPTRPPYSPVLNFIAVGGTPNTRFQQTNDGNISPLPLRLPLPPPPSSTSPITSPILLAPPPSASTSPVIRIPPPPPISPYSPIYPAEYQESDTAAFPIPGVANLSLNQPDTMATNHVVPPPPATSPPTAAAHAPAVGSNPENQMPSIRFVPHHDPRANRPSLTFQAISRTLPNLESIIKVGRYSERDQFNGEMNRSGTSSAPVGFKSKVVSRKHCEFWCERGQWYVRDVKSSSGTFLNHLRLSPPGVESKPWPVNDGDVVQLGIDFKGGEEPIYRCVKIRIECNRSWQKGLNPFK